MHRYILAVDQGTTSSKSLIMDDEARIVVVSDSFPIEPREPRVGCVEYDPWEMLQSVIDSMRSATARSGIDPARIAGFGLANQGETVIAFDALTGDPVFPAISWLDKRNADIAEELEQSGKADLVFQRTGLRLDPYFSAFKMRWILDNVDLARTLAAAGCLCLATSDAWLLWQLLETKRCITDPATASRTMLLDLESQCWDDELLELLEIPRDTLPQIVENDEKVGRLKYSLLSADIPVGGLCVDQHAAVFGQRCLKTGEVKATYGTGCFVHGNIGNYANRRTHGLLTSLGWRIGGNEVFVLDGGIFVAGRSVTWMAECLGMDSSFEEIDSAILLRRDTTAASGTKRCECAGAQAGETFFIPALAGLAAPYWNPEVSGGWYGLTTATKRSDLVYSVIESIAFRVRDIVDLMGDAGLTIGVVRADGGMTRSDAFMQLQADVLGVPIDIFEGHEATGFGIGLMSGIAHSFWSYDSVPFAAGAYRRIEPDRADRLEGRYVMWSGLVKKHMEMTG